MSCEDHPKLNWVVGCNGLSTRFLVVIFCHHSGTCVFTRDQGNGDQGAQKFLCHIVLSSATTCYVCGNPKFDGLNNKMIMLCLDKVGQKSG